MITKTQAIRALNTFGEFRNHWRVQLNRKLEQAAAALVGWLLSKRSVQRAVADAFNGGTPMCDVMDKAVESALEGRNNSIDPDDIEGLDRAIEGAIESAFSDRDFTDAVKDAIDLEELVQSIDLDELAEKVSERVIDELVLKLTR